MDAEFWFHRYLNLISFLTLSKWLRKHVGLWSLLGVCVMTSVFPFVFIVSLTTRSLVVIVVLTSDQC